MEKLRSHSLSQHWKCILFHWIIRKAVNNFVSAVCAFHTWRFSLEIWTSLKDQFWSAAWTEETYTALCTSLLLIGKIDKALFAAEEGLAETLSDNLFIQDELARGPSSAAKFDSKKAISLVLTELSRPTIFLWIEGLTINIWLLRRERKLHFDKGGLGVREEKNIQFASYN